MRYEHTLAPAAAQSFKAALEQLDALRREMLQALGAAKEIEMRSAALQLAVGQQLAIIQETEGLPRPVSPYQLSADCTKLIGEVPDRPAEPFKPAIVPIQPEVLVNGADHA